MKEGQELKEMLLSKDGSSRTAPVDAKWLRYFWSHAVICSILTM